MLRRFEAGETEALALRQSESGDYGLVWFYVAEVGAKPFNQME